MHLRIVAVSCLLVGTLAACSKNDNNTPVNADNSTVTAETIGAAGGEVSLAGGAGVDIPANALAEEVEIGISELSAAEKNRLAAFLGADLELVSELFAFTPHGTQFTVDVDITIPFDGMPAGLRVMRLDDENDETWADVSGASFAGSVASLATDRFSILGVVGNAGVVVANNDAGFVDIGQNMDASTTDAGGGDAGPNAGNWGDLPGTWTLSGPIPGPDAIPTLSMNASGDVLIASYNNDGLFVSSRTSGVWTHPADETDFVPFQLSLPHTGLADNGDASILTRASNPTAVYMSTRTGGVWTHPASSADRVDFPNESGNLGARAQMKMAPDGTGVMSFYYLYSGVYAGLGSGALWTYPSDPVNDAFFVGGNWGSSITGTSGVGVGNGGRAVVAYQQDDPDGQFIHLATYNGSWTNNGRIDLPNSQSLTSPWVAMGANGDAIVAWHAVNIGWGECINCPALYVSEYTNGVWTHPTDMSDVFNHTDADSGYVGTAATDVHVSVNDNGDATVIWLQEDSLPGECVTPFGCFKIYMAERKSGVWSKPTSAESIPFPALSSGNQAYTAAVSPTGDIIIARQGLDESVNPPRAQTYLAQRISDTWYVPGGPADLIIMGLGGALASSSDGWRTSNIAYGANGQAILAINAFDEALNDHRLHIAEFEPQ